MAEQENLRHQLIPIIVGAVLGGLLTGIPTLWVAQSQLGVQVELARRADAELARQRRLQAAKDLLVACSDAAVLTERLGWVVKDQRAFQAGVLQWQQAQNAELIALAEVAAEFPGAPHELPPLSGVLGLQDTAAVRLLPTDEEMARRLVARAATYEEHCRSLVSTLLMHLRGERVGR